MNPNFCDGFGGICSFDIEAISCTPAVESYRQNAAPKEQKKHSKNDKEDAMLLEKGRRKESHALWMQTSNLMR